MNFLQLLLSGLLRSAEASVVNGLKKGLDYERKDQVILSWAVRTGNVQAIADVVAAGEKWVKETYDTAGNLLPRVVTYIDELVEGKSPSIDIWAGSRKLSQDLWEKYSHAAGVK